MSERTNERKNVVSVTVVPSQVLVDEVCEITVSGLTRAQPVTVCAQHRAENDVVFVSHAHYTADETGSVHVASHASTGGSYQGVEAMGLFWALHADPSQRPGARLMKLDVTSAQVFSLYVVDGHQSAAVYKCAPRLATTSLYRWYMAPGVQRYPVKSGRLVATLFLPPGPGPFPGVIDMFGMFGGIMEYKAALMASRGFAAMSLAYVGMKGLPQGDGKQPIEMEYFNEAVEFLLSHPKVQKRGVGMVGVSKGAELCMTTATLNPAVRAVVSINGTCYLQTGAHTYKKKLLPFARLTDEKTRADEDGVIALDNFSGAHGATQAIIKVERAENAHFLFVTGGGDMQVSPDMSKVLAHRLKQHGKSNYLLLVYPRAGHTIEPPYAPLCKSGILKLYNVRVNFGGDTAAHAVAQRESWHEILTFLRRRMCPEEDLSPPHSDYLCDVTDFDPSTALHDPLEGQPIDYEALLQSVQTQIKEAKRSSKL